MSSSRGRDGDERFQRVQKDPRFWEMPERDHKVKIDKRFKSMFSDERFRVKYTVDKRGRPSNHTSTEDLKRFYKVSDSEEEEEEQEEETKKVNRVTQKQVRKGGAEQPEEPSDQEEEEEDEVSGSSDEDEDAEDLRDLGGPDQSEEDSDSGPDLARGKGNVETSSEDEEDDVDVVLRRREEEEVEHAWGDLCRDAPRSDEVSARLAVCNLDWARLKARDLLVLLRSFTPPGGAVLSVKIYPSDFGKERLKLEETRGPLELRALPNDSDDDTEEQRVHREKMRDYQFKRLKYFYAVVEFDSAHTAEHVYQECDGYEYESSCSCLDLRFVPDDVIFEEEPTDVATDVDVAAYTPKLFTSSGSTTSKVQLTWDETDHERVAAMSRRFNRDELLDMDFRAYLASSSEEEPEEEEGRGGESTEKRSEEQLCKYRELLRGVQEKERRLQEDRDMDMEVTWVPGLKETTEQLVRRRLEQQEPLTPWEEFLQKKKEKKKLKRSERKQEEQQQQEEEEELPADVDLTDPFFAEELTGTHRKQKVTAKKKKKKKEEEEEEEQTAEEQEEQQKQKEEMLLLMDDHDQHHHFNYDQIVEQQNLSRRKRRKMMRKGEELLDQDHFQVDVKDPRFQAMFTSPLFHLDPSHPAYRNTRATHSFLSEKQRRRQREGRGQDGEGRGQDREGRGRQEEESVQQQDERDQQEEELAKGEEGRAHRGATPPEGAGPRMDPGLSLLVKSIKTKTEAFRRRKQKV